jgi:catechol 2,3-dioxygenase-like lactoylglutathione lyase family enzyme
MITKMSHTAILVLNQEEAYDFYVNKLGFKVHTDASMGNGFRWLTVTPPEQPDLQITLMEIKPGMMWDEKTAETVKELVKSGKFGAGVFETNDVRATYEELKAKGVKFSGPPEEKFYGIETIMSDNSGNWFSVTERVKQ